MNLNEFYLLGNRIQLFDVMDDFEESLSQLYALTNNLIIITAGKEALMDMMVHCISCQPIKLKYIIQSEQEIPMRECVCMVCRMIFRSSKC